MSTIESLLHMDRCSSILKSGLSEKKAAFVANMHASLLYYYKNIDRIK
jgi:hypothetical protein